MFLEKHRLLPLPPAEFARLVVDDEKCNGCGRCVKSCPIQLLELQGKKSRSNERYDHFRCITCESCVAVCPQDAITIEGDYRVPAGFWKNKHLYSGTKTLPAPLAKSEGKPFESFEGKLTETERVIYNRRSIRLYKKKQVPRNLVERVLEAGRFAPSAGNNQPWKFVVIRGPEAVSTVNERCREALKKVSYISLPHPWTEKQVPGDKTAKLKKWQQAVLQVLVRVKTGEIEPRARGGINAASSDPDYDIFFGAPTVILLLGDKRGVGDVGLDMGICGQNMVLAAHALGLGTCFVSLAKAVNFYGDLKKSMGIDDPFKVCTSLTLGYPAGQIDRPVSREQLRVEWVDKL